MSLVGIPRQTVDWAGDALQGVLREAWVWMQHWPLTRAVGHTTIVPVPRLQQPSRAAMHIECPHCHSPIEVVQPATPEEIVCPSCGSSFRLEQGATTEQLASTTKTLGRFLLLDV